MMNLIGLDISVNSTGLSIFKDDKLELYNFTTIKDSYIWVKKTIEYINFEFINYTYSDNDDYSEKEIIKLVEFNKISDIIFDKICENINKDEKTYICIEGYNFGFKQNTNSITDIVCISTILKSKLLNIPNLEQMLILSPKSIKSYVAEMVYGTTQTINKRGTKKIINKSPDGVSGGNFSKHDMLKAIIDSDYDDILTNIVKKNKDEILKMKNIPKPFDDICDSYWIVKVLSNILKSS